MRQNLLLMLLLFTSCMGKGDKGSTLRKEVSLECTSIEALESDLFTIGDYPEINWWEDLQDDSLTCLIEAALAENPSLAGTEKRVSAANQEALMVRSLLFPDVSGMFQYFFLYLKDAHFIQELLPALSTSNFLYNLLFNFNYEFDFWGKNKKKYEAALGSAKSIRFEHEEAKIILSTTIATSYFNLVAMKAKKEVLNNLLANKEKLLSLIVLRKKNRIDSRMDEYTYTQQVKAMEDAVTAVNAEIALETSLINILANRNPESNVETDPVHKVFDYKIDMPEEITSTLLSRRPDLLSSLWITKKNALDVGISITNFLPSVTLMDGPALVTNTGSKLFNADSFANLLFPEVTQPLFTGGRLLAAWKKSVAVYHSSIDHFNSLFLKAAKEVYDSVTTYIASEERRADQEERLFLAKQNYELEFLRFENGICSMIPVLTYDEIFLQNKVLMIERDRAKRVAYIAFVKSLGGGFKERKEEKITKGPPSEK
ncbi:MAG: Outer membrane protein OprM [Chlamydiia bacterium]|nr:Outer membrane protein OprM [Chlamydiia bacterium]